MHSPPEYWNSFISKQQGSGNSSLLAQSCTRLHLTYASSASVFSTLYQGQFNSTLQVMVLRHLFKIVYFGMVCTETACTKEIPWSRVQGQIFSENIFWEQILK